MEQIHAKIREKITTPTLSINRVPLNTFKRFKEFASEEEFSSDYGMALKYLLDYHDGRIPDGFELLSRRIDELNARIDALESNIEEKKKKPHRLG